MTRVRIGRHAAVLLALALLVACGDEDANALRGLDVETEVGTEPLAVNEHSFVGFSGFSTHGADQIRFRSARLTGVPSGMRVHGIWAVDKRTTGGVVLGGASPEEMRQIRRQPVNQVRLTPGQREDWFLIAEVSASRRGTFRTRGIEITYEAGGKKGAAEYPYAVAVRVETPT